MSRASGCWWVQGEERAPRYVAGTLPEAEVERLEAHLLECEVCQRTVHEAVTLHAATTTARRPRLPVRRSRVAAAGVLAAAAAVAALLLARAPDPVRALGALGGDLPAFEGMAVRSTTGARAVADSGMDAYAAGRFQDAARLLARASNEEATPGLHFFLGVSRLTLRDHEGAAAALTSALDPPGNPYEVEARLYLAKAHLASGDAPGALAVLAAVPSADGSPVARHARALADSVREARR